MISVVVPVLDNIKYTTELFEDINNCIYKPSEIILIDNNSSDDYQSLVKKYSSLNIEYIKLPENIGVNKAWNMGIQKSKNELVSVLNNDIRINKYFFKKILETMKDFLIGICIPNTKRSSSFSDIDENVLIIKAPRREGWAFTIRKSIPEKYGYIPLEYYTFFGDDYLFYITYTNGIKIVKMMNNNIFHYVSKTVELDPLYNEIFDKEKNLWNETRDGYSKWLK